VFYIPFRRKKAVNRNIEIDYNFGYGKVFLWCLLPSIILVTWIDLESLYHFSSTSLEHSHFRMYFAMVKRSKLNFRVINVGINLELDLGEIK
jgi:hypothetical protein